MAMEERSVQTDLSSPSVQKIVAGLYTVGLVETGYLSYTKLFVPDGINKICGLLSASCSLVLDSPYANLQIRSMMVLLTIVGFMAYTLVAILSIFPLLSQGKNKDNDNSTTSDSNASDVTTTTQMEKTHEIITLQLHA